MTITQAAIVVCALFAVIGAWFWAQDYRAWLRKQRRVPTIPVTKGFRDDHYPVPMWEDEK